MIKIKRRKEKYIDGKLHRLCACGCNSYFLVKESYPNQKFIVSGHARIGAKNTKEAIDKMLASQGLKRRVSIFCLCGCGRITSKGSRYMVGHGTKGTAKPKTPPQLCKCGCGQMTNIGNTYIYGHTHCMPHTEETKQKIREKRKLQVFSDTVIRKRAESMKKKWAEEGYKEKLKKIQSLAVRKPWSDWSITEEKRRAIGKYVRTAEWKEKKSEAYKGENSVLWKGGISFEEYPREFNEFIKKQIRKRDGNMCQVCFTPQNKLNHKLNIHHINYDKKNCDYNNLISLCRNCHAKTNHSREQWQSVFAIQ